MFLGLNLIDWILIVGIIAYVWAGWRKAFLVSLGGTAGFLAGATASFFCIPLAARWIQDPAWRAAGLFLTFAFLLALGHGLGEAAAAQIRRWMDRPRPRWWDRLGGALVHFVAAGVTISALAFTLATLGMPWLSPQLAQSHVVAAARASTPDFVDRALGEARAAVAELELPEISTPLTGGSPNVEVPQDAEMTEAQQAARASVARVTGTAAECGINQTGTSFAIAPDRLVTNAHVVRGIEQPVVETPDGRALTGRTVVFDPERDIAILAVEGLDMPALTLGPPLSQGDSAVFMGFPAGGPFSVAPAAVQQRTDANLPDIEDNTASPVNVYQLAANIQRGNSGGPLVAKDGTAAGLIFAKSKDDANVGYAVTNHELSRCVDIADQRDEAVPTGRCTQ